MQLRYVAYNADGQRMVGQLEAESRESAETLLTQSGLMVTQISKAAKLPSRHEMLPTVFGFKPQHIINFYRGLATLLESGVPLRQTLRIIYEQSPHPALKDAIRQTQRFVEEGLQLSEAFAQSPKVFKSLHVRRIKIAEGIGRLAPELNRIANDEQKETEARQKVVKALAYPALVLVMSSVAIFVLITFSLPAMAGLFTEFGAKMPFLSRVLVSVGNFGSAHGGQTIMVLFVLLAVGWYYSRTPAGKKRFDHILSKLPAIRSVIQARLAAWFTGTLATLTEGGIRLVEAIDLMIENAPNDVLRRALVTVREDLLNGATLSAAVSRQKVFPALVRQSIAVAEESGHLVTQLTVAAKFYEEEADRKIGQLTGVIEPAIILTVGAVVGTVGVAVISTVYSLLPAISK